MLAMERTARLLGECYGMPISAATVMAMIRQAEGILSPSATRIGEAVAQAPAAGADETGLRVAGKLQWLHTAVTEALTWMGLHARWGKEAFACFGILYPSLPERWCMTAGHPTGSCPASMAGAMPIICAS
jgi:transposase